MCWDEILYCIASLLPIAALPVCVCVCVSVCMCVFACVCVCVLVWVCVCGKVTTFLSEDQQVSSGSAPHPQVAAKPLKHGRLRITQKPSGLEVREGQGSDRVPRRPDVQERVYLVSRRECTWSPGDCVPGLQERAYLVGGVAVQVGGLLAVELTVSLAPC